MEAALDWESVAAIFLENVRDGYLAELVTTELAALGCNPDHVINAGVNQYTLTPVSLPGLEYSVRIVTPFSSRPHIVKWLGMRQIISMKGDGYVRVSRYRAPPGTCIETFEPGIGMQLIERVEMCHLDTIMAADKLELLDIDAVSEPAVLEILTFKADAGAMIWTFDETMHSVYAEQALPVISRFRNVVALAAAMGRQVPGDIYNKALQSPNAHLALAALEALLAQGGMKAFAALHEAINSGDDGVREGAERLFALMTASRDTVHAA